MSTPVSKFLQQQLPGSGCKPSSKPQVISQYSRGEMKTPAGPQLYYYYRIHEYWLIIKVFPAALTLLPGSELLVRIKNGCFLPFITGDSRLGRPNIYYYYLVFEERLPIKVFCRSSSVHGCGSKTPEP